MNIDVNSQNNNVVTCEMLSQQITLVQDTLQAQATHAVNLALTARNWLIGYYIVNYEQHGADRAQYGAQLMSRLAKRINRRGLDARRLREFRLFYLAYPQLLSAVENYVLTNAEIGSRSDKAQIWRLPSAILQSTEIKEDVIWRMPSAKLEKWQTPPERLFRRLNYSNLLYLSSITDDLKRAFYEQEAIAGCWVIKEENCGSFLKRIKECRSFVSRPQEMPFREPAPTGRASSHAHNVLAISRFLMCVA